MSDVIIGRKVEQEILRQRIESRSPELIAIYGRRRIGKTFLVRQYFNDTFAFYSTGIYKGTKKEQLREFTRQLEYYSGRKWEVAKDWFDAFGSDLVHMHFLDGDPYVHNIWGDGNYPLEQMLRCLKANDYTGYLVQEIADERYFSDPVSADLWNYRVLSRFFSE